jgi:dTDP-glucose 4,6-dehydratase
MKALVTGAAGFLGAHLCRTLLDQGAEVVAVDNLITGDPTSLRDCSRYSRFRFIRADLAHECPQPEQLDLVFHLACPASPLDYDKYPVATLLAGSHGTLNALRAAHERGARFFLASTSEVYGDPTVYPQSESYPGNVKTVGPRSSYSEAKRFSEALTIAYAREFGVDVRIARLFNIYGPRMRATDGRVIPAFFSAALDSKPIEIFGSGVQTRSFCYITDAVRGILALMDSNLTLPVNIGNPDEVQINALATMIKEITKSNSPIVSHPARSDDPHRRCPDIALARAELGWEPAVPLEVGLRQTFEWLKSLSLPVTS